MNNLKFNVGGFLVHDSLIVGMVKKFQDELDLTLPIKTVFGSVNARLNYGRPDFNMKISLHDIKKSIKEYNELGIGINLTFSRVNVSEEDLQDYNSNLLFDLIAENDLNGLIITDDKVYNYFKKKKPNVKTTFSHVGSYHHHGDANNRLKIYKEKESYYDYIVPNANDNFNFEFLESIKDKSQYELLVNQLCIRNCPHESEHDDTFRNHMDDILNLDNLTNIRNFRKFKCPVRCTGDFKFDKDVEYEYHTREHFQKLQDIGFTNFKLKGREDVHNQMLYDICNFIIPEKYAKKAYDSFCKW